MSQQSPVIDRDSVVREAYSDASSSLELSVPLPIPVAVASKSPVMDGGPVCDGCCDASSSPVSYCSACGVHLCEKCWEGGAILHRKENATRPAAVIHQKTDPHKVRLLDTILRPSNYQGPEVNQHAANKHTKWFGCSTDEDRNPVLEEFDAYPNIISRSVRYDETPKCPQLVSFVGGTGAGKSTVVGLLIKALPPTPPTILKHQDFEFTAPVVGTHANGNVPTSADVHLYADPTTYYDGTTPVLYADCEGLDAGDIAPMENAAPIRNEVAKSDRNVATHHIPRQMNSRVRRLEWAGTDTPPPHELPAGVQTSDRAFIVENLYPRLLYTFSDVVVFVSENSRTFQHALWRLIAWGAKSLEHSVNQPALPHVILLLNRTSRDVPVTEWDVDSATQNLLIQANTIPSKKVKDLMASLGLDVNEHIPTVEGLIKRYYSTFSVMRFPQGDQHNLLWEQIQNLRTRIHDLCKRSHKAKLSTNMLLQSDTFNIYLRYALDHFAATLDSPFNFVKVSLKLHPTPGNFGDHVVRLAANMCDSNGNLDRRLFYESWSKMVASSIVLDHMRKTKQGWASGDDYFSHYQGSLNQAFKAFCTKFWPCAFSKGDEKCVNVKASHDSKGHQNADGKVIQAGSYIPDRHFDTDLVEKWGSFLRSAVTRFEECLRETPTYETGMPRRQWIAHLEIVNDFLRYFAPEGFRSQKTCFGCLMAVPEHHLACGHVLCTRCVKEIGEQLPTWQAIKMTECPLHTVPEAFPSAQIIRFNPPLAGVRLLSLDSTNVCGIVQLKVLQALEGLLPNIPLQAFFDLIVGTSGGGTIALGLGASELALKDCTSGFTDLCRNGFAHRKIHYIPIVGKLITRHRGHKFKTRRYHSALKDFLQDSPLFGYKSREHLTLSSDVKVALAAANETGQKAIVLATYNRAEMDTAYVFDHPENHKDELNVWEAAAASSATPGLFKPFLHEKTNRAYLGGALFHSNPINIAISESKCLWPDSALAGPDVVLSVGAGRSQKRSEPDSRISTYSDSFGSTNMPKGHRTSPRDPDMIWKTFMDGRNASETSDRYIRINPLLPEVPEAGDSGRMRDLQALPAKYLLCEKELAGLRKVALHLVASLFYLDSPYPAIFTKDSVYRRRGNIKCRFSEIEEHTPHIVALGAFLQSKCNGGGRVWFEVTEQGEESLPHQIDLSESVLRHMTSTAAFDLGSLSVTTSHRLNAVDITLNFGDDQGFSISGFPRQIMCDPDPPRPATAPPSTPSALSSIQKEALDNSSPLPQPRGRQPASLPPEPRESQVSPPTPVQRPPVPLKRRFWIFRRPQPIANDRNTSSDAPQQPTSGDSVASDDDPAVSSESSWPTSFDLRGMGGAFAHVPSEGSIPASLQVPSELGERSRPLESQGHAGDMHPRLLNRIYHDPRHPDAAHELRSAEPRQRSSDENPNYQLTQSAESSTRGNGSTPRIVDSRSNSVFPRTSRTGVGRSGVSLRGEPGQTQQAAEHSQ